MRMKKEKSVQGEEELGKYKQAFPVPFFSIHSFMHLLTHSFVHLFIINKEKNGFLFSFII